MKRRAFLSLFGGAAAAWPLSIQAATGKRPVVGFMVSGSQASYAQNIAGFVHRMRELGWTDGDNVAIVYRWADGVTERFAEKSHASGRQRHQLVGRDDRLCR